MKKRRHKRYEVEKLNGHILYPIDAHILNISLNGMAIESTRKLNVNKEFTLNIRNGRTLDRLTGNVVWCTLSRTARSKTNETVPIYKAGLKFHDILTDKGKSVYTFIDTNKETKLQTRFFARFKPTRSKKIHIDYVCGFHVKMISLSGMLIDTDFFMDLNTVFNISITHRDVSLRLKGRVAYANQSRDSVGDTSCRLGIEFIDLSEEDRGILKKYILKDDKPGA